MNVKDAMIGKIESETLKKIAVYGAAFSVIGAAFCHHRIQANLASQDYYKKSVEAFRKHPQAVAVIGPPVGFRYMNLGRSDIRVNHLTANIVIPVRGQRTSGNLYCAATRDNNKWTIRTLELEVDRHTRRISIIKQQDPETEATES